MQSRMMFLEAHPRWLAGSGGRWDDEITAKQVSENSILQRKVRFVGTSCFNARLINCLSGNTRVREVILDLDCCLDSDDSLRSLVDWINWRGGKCELHLVVSRPVSVFDSQQFLTLIERRASVLSSSTTNLNLKKLHLRNLNNETLSDELMTNIFSLVTAETEVQLQGMSTGTMRRRVLPHVQGIATSDLHVDYDLDSPTNTHEFFESILSPRNIWGQLTLAVDEDPVLFQLMDCLNQYLRQDGATLSLLYLCVSYPERIGRALATALERIPSGLPVKILLGLSSDFGGHETDEALLQSLLSLPSLTSLALYGVGLRDLSQWVDMIEGLCHGRLHSFSLLGKITTAHCLTRSLHSSDLQELSLCLMRTELVDVTHAMADVLPTMTCLKDFEFRLDKDDFRREFERISNEQDHDDFLTTSTSRYVPTLCTYIAYDALYTAVCDHSPSITTCQLPKFTGWHRDRLAFALQTRLICVEKLLSGDETTPLSLLPLALSRLSEGYWYDIMAYIVRQKSDLLIAPTAAVE